MKPNDITLVPAPGNQRKNVYRLDPGPLGELSQALRKDTMAEYVENHPPS
jgi:hypothetical protein